MRLPLSDSNDLANQLKYYRGLAETAHMLGVTKGRVASMRREGLIVGIHSPAGWLFSLAEIERAKAMREARLAERAAKRAVRESAQA